MFNIFSKPAQAPIFIEKEEIRNLIYAHLGCDFPADYIQDRRYYTPPFIVIKKWIREQYKDHGADTALILRSEIIKKFKKEYPDHDSILFGECMGWKHIDKYKEEYEVLPPFNFFYDDETKKIMLIFKNKIIEKPENLHIYLVKL